ncbi:MAG: hypothetical protein HFH62_11740 [Lachnospiraceae bacterium]|nr:hypothetical protein [Lachnospiraceae bacterium]
MSISPIDEELFRQACQEIIHANREKNGIGTLQEKTVHAVLKRFYEPDISHQEIRIGSFVADIFRAEEIIEIQTRNFNAMRRKLDFFLQTYPVTIVYPIPHTKWLYWIDEETGTVTNKRKSPKTGSLYDAYYELYKIKPYLTHPNLHLCLVLVDVEEYRLLNGWSRNKKRGSTRYDRIPLKLVDEFYIGGPGEYGCMIPENLPIPFTSKDFAKKAKIPQKIANLALNILYSIHAVERVGKQGNAYLYEMSDSLPHKKQGT